jgi:hypothetical protein
MKRERGSDWLLCRQEYEVSKKFLRSLERIGVEAKILNDFTRADMIARTKGSCDDRWLKIQVKTTSTNVIGKPTVWQLDSIVPHKGSSAGISTWLIT